MEEAGRHAACPDEEIVLTCRVVEGFSLLWIAEPFITRGSDTFRYVFTDAVGKLEETDGFIANLTENQEVSGTVRNLTSTLTFNATAVSSQTETVFECQDIMATNTTLHIAGNRVLPPLCNQATPTNKQKVA